MEEQPSKRRGRPRKVVVLPADDAKVSPAPDHDDGNGQARSDGHPAQANAARPPEVSDWLMFIDAVDKAVRSNGHAYVSAALYPSPVAPVIASEYDVPVIVGEPAIRTKHGQILTIQALRRPAL